MHGNVDEWCQDWHLNYYDTTLTNDPSGPSSGEDRMIRGGGWIAYQWHCRSAARDWTMPDLQSNDLGFRVACSVE